MLARTRGSAILILLLGIWGGIVPFVGDVADFFWKSNAKNFALLERHAAEVRPATRGDWIFVVGVVGSVVAMALVPLVVLYLIVQSLVARAY